MWLTQHLFQQYCRRILYNYGACYTASPSIKVAVNNSTVIAERYGGMFSIKRFASHFKIR
jgi:hypothetical protein